MAILNKAAASARLKAAQFEQLFIEELGWDRHNARPVLDVGGTAVVLNAIAEKRGMVAYHHSTAEGATMPDHAARRKIERQVAKLAHEHLIVFTDARNTVQVWQWVKRETGKPNAVREHTYHTTLSGEPLIQRLQGIAVTMEEEEGITLPDVTGRVRSAFDVEKVTKKFYDQFKKEHGVFHDFISGIPETGDHDWYASVMLNRLMFVYFIQRKGFLDGDPDYLSNRLERCKREHGQDRFYSFYREFLLRLFHEGLGGKDRPRDLDEMIGRVPYLNGGLFEQHEIELKYPDLQIPDEAFERVFDYFDQYQWHLDERPLRNDKEINPDVLGYIFEKYINQKQMGAYYTKEDITEYISKNTVIPFLLDSAQSKCKVAFENPGGPTVWDRLRDDPDRYVYPAVRHGVDLPLPKDIAAGVNPPTLHDPVGDGPVQTLELRKGWNKSAPSEYALPTEIWREVVARRTRYEETFLKLAGGEVRDVNDLITLNLDIRQFAQDVIENCEGPELLRAFWHAVEKITILDPTCGSGAFLFAALNILQPLYDACLDRMEAFVEDLERSGEKHHPEKYSDFRRVLENVAAHPNRAYFIYKGIILNNLYGVDIMEEAVEICKLRLFLKLAAQVDPEPKHENYGIEPLPDIDFNIRAGNTLVGFATYEDVEKALTYKMDFDSAMEKVSVRAADLQQLFDRFRERQVGSDGSVPAEHKAELRRRLDALDEELNEYVAREYGVDPGNTQAFEKWKASHQPFHWFVEFYGIMDSGGFDVIIGNPPYLEGRQVDYTPRGYICGDSGAVHAMCIERSTQLLDKSGCMSMIVPLALPSTQRMHAVQRLLEPGRHAWYANFAWRPGKLFDTVNRALTIFIVGPSNAGETHSTGYQKWTSDDRGGLLHRIKYARVPRERPSFWVPKLSTALEQDILDKLLSVRSRLGHFVGSSTGVVYYRTTGGLYWKVFTDFAPTFRLNGQPGHSSRETCFSVAKGNDVKPLIAALSSDVFWWWYTITTNLRDLNPSDIQNFPLPEATLSDEELSELGQSYLADMNKNSTILIREQKQTGTTETQSFKIQKSKGLIEEIDHVLAQHSASPKKSWTSSSTTTSSTEWAAAPRTKKRTHEAP